MHDYDLNTVVGKDAVIERHSQFNFSDGDILLLAKSSLNCHNDRHYLLFHVHEFMLRHNSAIFDYMFEDATSGADVYNGVPLVQMAGDNAEDLALILTYLYNPSKIPFRRLDPDTPISISGAVRLANKFLMDWLRLRLIRHVTEDWPRSLHEWDEQEARAASVASSIATDPGARPPGYRRLSDCIPEPAAAIVFAYEFACPEILPAAFYELARIRADEDWARRSEPGADAQDSARLARLARWDLLDRATLMRYMRGCARLDDFGESMLAADAIGSALSAECRPWWSRPGASAAREGEGGQTYPCFDFVRAMFESAWTERRTRDPLRALKECLEWERPPTQVMRAYPEGLCERCRHALQKWVADKRQFLWRSLPDLFET